ncbi:RimJ/RimL family protein N-acetyltransferase [Streptomyces aurantiacus]|uniref:GNAT family N-acetyltransferase n=1 Tax=Streptomyces aurantiacus TaxID=47760 RepID=UPI002790CEC4|nr:GNAT family N-acetyltransferase [Streptomyces aurantiacus]MDQ0779511.1 RimJ/RimL family protein N-acetyltransferase [Streptomyces aurantiacus]
MNDIRTPRLLLRRWQEDDLLPLAEIHADPTVMQWIGDGRPRSLEETAEDIEAWEEEWDEEGFGLFAVELLGSGELAGAVGLYVADSPPELAGRIAISWRLGRVYWGQGYASEAAHAALEFALQDRGIDQVVAAPRPGDSASANVLDKLGMKAEGSAQDPIHGHDLRLYSIDLTEFEG